MRTEPDDSTAVPVARGHRGHRRRVWSSLLAAAAAVLVTATPGTAAAADTTSTVTPVLDCYTANSDGSYTVILGYSNTAGRTTSIPLGPRNIGYPAKFQGVQPTTFQPGTQHGVFSVKVTQADLYSNARWELDGHTLNYQAAAYASGICTAAQQLPATGNGTGIAVGLLAAGGIGVLVVRRAIRRAGDDTGPVAGDA